jgi:hypothetical protein
VFFLPLWPFGLFLANESIPFGVFGALCFSFLRGCIFVYMYYNQNQPSITPGSFPQIISIQMRETPCKRKTETKKYSRARRSIRSPFRMTCEPKKTIKKGMKMFMKKRIGLCHKMITKKEK